MMMEVLSRYLGGPISVLMLLIDAVSSVRGIYHIAEVCDVSSAYVVSTLLYFNKLSELEDVVTKPPFGEVKYCAHVVMT
jgi:hypothetical protein